MAVVLERVLPIELEKRGIEDASDLCRELGRRVLVLPTDPIAAETESPESIFQRLGKNHLMLAHLAMLSTLVFIGASAFVGIRLLRLAQKTRGLPEFLLGYAFTMITCVSYPLILLSHAVHQDANGLARLLWVIVTLSSASSWSFLFFFVHNVFHRGVRASQCVTAAGAVAMLAAAVFRFSLILRIPRIEDLDQASPAMVGITAVAMVGYCWMTFESLRYWRIMKRRQAIGLGDLVVVNRFLIFALVAFFSIIAISARVLPHFFGTDPVDSPVALALTAIGGLSTSICLWLAFVPPASFERWIRDRGQAQFAESA